jgi:cell division protein FtsB
MAKLSTLLLAALLDSPALYHAFVAHDMDYTTALIRYLIAVVVATLMLWLLRALANVYHSANEAEASAVREAARAEAREAAQEAALDALDVARADPAVMAQARRSTDGPATGELAE